MSNKNVPDKAPDFDDATDVPTYNARGGSSASSASAAYAASNPMSDTRNSAPKTGVDGKAPQRAENASETTQKRKSRPSIFKRAGRAQPQEIKPDSHNSAQATEHIERPQQRDARGVNDAQTTAFQTPSRDEREVRETQIFDRRGDEAYADRDFAPADRRDARTEVVPAAAGAGAGAGVAGYQDDNLYREGGYDQRGDEHYATQEYDRGYRDTEYADDRPVDEDYRREEDRANYREYGRRGTIDFGLLFVRLALGTYLVIAGLRTFFNLGGSEGLGGLESEFANYSLAGPLSIIVPILQLVAGVFIILGLLTPFAAMIGLVVTGFMALHELATSGSGFDVFSWPESVWLSLVLFVIAVALQFTGPGFLSLDFKQSWARRPLATSWIFVVLGIAALVALWWFGTGVNPLA